MGELLERIKLSNLVYGDGIADNFKNNSLFFYEAYSKSQPKIQNISKANIQVGGFYFFHYLDDSNWMQYSPVFTVSFKKFGNLIIIIALNFNFIPLEVRATIFDKFIKEEDFEKDNLLAVDYEGIYSELIKYGFEYSLVEYNLHQIKYIHKISLDLIPRFLYSQHPINKYDPKKLYEIWSAKIKGRGERHEEMSKSMIDEFFKVSDDILENYTVLKNHITRIQKSIGKFGE